MNVLTIDQSDMRRELRQVYGRDPEARLLQVVVRSLADPVKPEDTTGRFRPHPLVMVLGILGIFAVCVCAYFTFSQP